MSKPTVVKTPPRVLPTWPGTQRFVFDTPLYERIQTTAHDGSDELVNGSGRIDGHCVSCGQNSVFARSAPNYGSATHAGDAANKIHEIAYGCVRDNSHAIRIFVKVAGDAIQKVGQFPSLADITNDAAKHYRKILDTVDRQELSRAVGLAAHGIGIGSFVYLRRVFERLIEKRIASSEIDPAEFLGKRMGEKIALLKHKLPEFLVSNSSIYGILSAGIHELTEQQCLAFYDVLHESILVILEDDQRKQEDLERRVRLSEAISSFKSKDP
jgi:hypothetical protein